MHRFLSGRFVRFLLVGGLNTAFSYALFAVCILIGMAYPIAALLAAVISVLFNFKSYGTLVFGSRDSSRILRFFGVYALTYGIGVLLLRIAHAHHLSLLVAAAVFAPPMAVLSFTLNRLFVFHRSK